jgi:hypothetical protein
MIPLLLEHDLINVAPAPILAWLEGLDNRMVGGMKMPRRVLVLREIAAADVSTGQAHAQVDPGITGFQAVLTALCAWCNLSYLITMGTRLYHILLPFLGTPGD